MAESFHPEATAPSVTTLLADQRDRWRHGDTVRVEAYVAEHPSLGSNGEALLDLIYNEMLLREECGIPFDLSDYLERFPSLAEPISDLFKVHGLFDQATRRTTSETLVDPSGSPFPFIEPTAAPGWPELDGYTVLGVLGKGGMGVVYRARDERRGVTVALKTMQQVEPMAIYRFKQEFRTLLDVSHPNLISLHELISDGHSWFIVMEFIDGVDFLAYVRNGGEPAPKSGGSERDPGAPREEPPKFAGLTPEQRIRLRESTRQLAEGLMALHQAGKLHRDIKPSNVMVTADGAVVLMDFGLATEQSRGESIEGHLVGTAAYMAPEQAAEMRLSEASDWYSVGVMLYEALAGRRPFLGGTLQILMDKQKFEPAPPHELVPDVSEDLDTLCVELLRRDPRARPPGREVLRRLGSTVGDSFPGSAAVSSHGTESLFIGRESLRAAMADALETMIAGRTVVVFVRGRSGVGKSALIQKFLDDLTAANTAVVVSGRCYERESVPYKALDSLIDSLSGFLKRLPSHKVQELLPRDVAPLARVFPVLRRVEAVAAAPRRGSEVPDPQQLRRRAYAALRELLARLGDRHPLVLAIDDLQWGDVDSLAVFSEVLRPPDAPVLLVIASFRSEEAAENPFLRAISAWPGEGTPYRRELDVEPLSFYDARALALRLLGGSGPLVTRQAEAVARESGGNPFFVAELARSVQGGTAQGNLARPGRPLALDDVLWARILRLPDDARRLLEFVSVSGRPVAPSAAWQCLDRAASDERTALALLRTGRLIRQTGERSEGERIETYHDRIRETVVAHLDSSTRKECHHRLALILEATGQADPEQLGVHFREGGEPERAGEHFARAAALAAEALAFDRSAKLYRVALELRPAGDATERRRLLAGLGEALANAGRSTEAARAYLGACEGTTVAEALEFRRRAAMQFLISGHIDQGLTTLRDVLAAVGMRLPNTPREALFSLLKQRAILRIRGLGFRPRDTSEVAAADLTRIDVSWSAGVGLSNVDWIRGADFQARGLLLALRAGEPSRVSRALAVEAAQSATGGSKAVRRTARLLEMAKALAGRTVQPYEQGMVTLAEGVSAYLEGRWRGALEACDRAETVFRDRCTGVTWELDTARAYALWALSHLGRWSELARRYPMLIDEARDRGDLYAEMNLSTYVLAIVRLAADEPGPARVETMRVMAQWSVAGYHVQHNDQVWASLMIDLYIGDGVAAWDRVRRHWPVLSRSLLLRVQFIRIAMWGLRGRCALAAATQGGPWMREAERAAGQLDREKTSCALAQSRLIRAGIAASRGRRDDAMRHVQAAAARYRETEMELFAVASEWRYGELLGGDEGRALQARAAAWMESEAIRRPDRVVAMVAPGFPNATLGG